MKRFVLVILAAVCLAACGASSSMAGSIVKRETVAPAPNAVEVADAAKRPTEATTIGHLVVPVSHPTNRLPVTPALRPAAPPPAADPDSVTPGFSCQGVSGPGKPKLMCAPQ